MSDLAITNDGRLSANGGNNSERLRHVANQFETTFVRMLLKDDQDSPFKGQSPIEEGPGAGQFKALLNDGLSERAAGHFGIADIVFRALSEKSHGQSLPKELPKELPNASVLTVPMPIQPQPRTLS